MSVDQNLVKTVVIRTDPPHLIPADGKTQLAERLLFFDAVKSSLDFLSALVLLVLTAPILLLAAIAIKLTSRGPVIYSQLRTGKDGKPFTIYKLRTMTHNCESVTGACWSTPGDSRITAVGRFLRRTHIDELPQLWNVLCGEMSLVGPRPERPEFVVKLEQAFPDYRKRLAVKPGLSGLAQIQLPPDTDLESVRRKLVYDIHYVDVRTLWLDFRIIVCTVCKVLALPLSVPRTLLQLPTASHVEGTGLVFADNKAAEGSIQTVVVDKAPLPACEAASFSSVVS